MTAAQVLTELQLHKVKLVADGNNLILRAKKDAMSSELRAAIIGHKAEILALLNTKNRHLVESGTKHKGTCPQPDGATELQEVGVIEIGEVKLKLFQSYDICREEGKCFRFRLQCRLFPMTRNGGQLSFQCCERF